MPLFDLPYQELLTYLPPRQEPPDFDQFWSDTLAQARRFPLDAVFEQVDFGLRTLESYDVTFNGYGGQPIKGWLMLPKQRPEALPCVVQYIGYGGGRGNPLDWLIWSSAGYAHLIIDSRGQGGEWLPGSTPDLEPEGSSPQFPGFMTRGVLDPKTYYYRRLITDAVRAVEAARENPTIDRDHIAITGRSQGGGLAIMVSALDPTIEVIMPRVPFLCHYRRATEITDQNPYFEITRYCQVHRDKIDTIFNTLSYFDGVNFAARAKARALFSVAMMDEVCPPSTVFAAYNYYAGEKEMRVFHYNEHEGGENFFVHQQVKFLSKFWNLSP